jgi:hypothetical protein
MEIIRQRDINGENPLIGKIVQSVFAEICENSKQLINTHICTHKHSLAKYT